MFLSIAVTNKEIGCKVEETKGVDCVFLCDLMSAFVNCECYYRIDPYREIYLEMDQVPDIKIFSESVVKWLEGHGSEENNVIQGCGLFYPKIRRFALDLGHVCDMAMEHGCGLVASKIEGTGM